jgi:hypothetical protein
MLHQPPSTQASTTNININHHHQHQPLAPSSTSTTGTIDMDNQWTTAAAKIATTSNNVNDRGAH